MAGCKLEVYCHNQARGPRMLFCILFMEKKVLNSINSFRLISNNIISWSKCEVFDWLDSFASFKFEVWFHSTFWNWEGDISLAENMHVSFYLNTLSEQNIFLNCFFKYVSSVLFSSIPSDSPGGEKGELNLGRAKGMSLTPHQCYDYGPCTWLVRVKQRTLSSWLQSRGDVICSF